MRRDLLKQITNRSENVTKEEILDYFKDINGAYNNCNMHDDLSRMLDELLKEQPKTKPMIHNSSADVWYYVCDDCNYPISPGDNYCGKCGKQIIWGKSIDT